MDHTIYLRDAVDGSFYSIGARKADLDDITFWVPTIDGQDVQRCHEAHPDSWSPELCLTMMHAMIEAFSIKQGIPIDTDPRVVFRVGPKE